MTFNSLNKIYFFTLTLTSYKHFHKSSSDSEANASESLEDFEEWFLNPTSHVSTTFFRFFVRWLQDFCIIFSFVLLHGCVWKEYNFTSFLSKFLSPSDQTSWCTIWARTVSQTKDYWSENEITLIWTVWYNTMF